MSNNKQTSLDWFLDELLQCGYIKKLPVTEFQQAKAMHKEEIERAHYEGSVIVISKPDDDMLQLSQQYYNETYLEAPKVILETTTTNTAKGYWVKHLKTFGGNNK